MSERKIQMVFFDAAGTLFDVRGSVGEIYARLAARYGKQVAAEELQRAFAHHFRQQPPMAFARELARAERLQCEQRWWRELVRQVFARFGAFPQFEDFFVEIFAFFRRPEAWTVFADVATTLGALKQQGLRLGVISNFDTRLYDVLHALGLRAYFDAIHISTEVGAAKPDPAIFHTALAANGLQPAQALHVGDSWREDVLGAQAAGLSALWLDRNWAAGPAAVANRVARLSPDLLENFSSL
jgi:putative hydrolase of the HAD superfamily